MSRISLLLFFCAVGCAIAGPVPDVNEERTNFIGFGTETLATSLLENYDIPESAVFSPLGFNVLLAIYAEGARGTSRQEIEKALCFPENVDDVRREYQLVLTRLLQKRGAEQSNVPEMKNWFYIYNNQTVHEDFSKVLREYYLTDVKNVNEPQDFVEPDLSDKKKIPVGLQGKPTEHVIDVDKEVISIIENANSPHKSDGEEATSNNLPALFDGIKENDMMNKPVDETKVPNNIKDIKSDVTENPTTTDWTTTNEPTTTEQATTPSDENKITQKKKNKVENEIMMAVQRSFENDVDQNGKSKSSMKMSSKDPIGKSKAVVFNGLYFKGKWAVPFVKYPADDSRPFYKPNGEKVTVSTLIGKGAFRTAHIPELNARVLELPYEENQYSLLIVVPEARDGIEQLILNFKNFSLHQVVPRLEEKTLDVCLPVFNLVTVGKSISAAHPTQMLANISSIFDANTADFSGISSELSLFVEELVQVVLFKVNANDAEANFLSASILGRRSDLETFEVNQPFLFFLRDNRDGIIVVNGQVCDPTSGDNELRTSAVPVVVGLNA